MNHQQITRLIDALERDAAIHGRRSIVRRAHALALAGQLALFAIVAVGSLVALATLGVIIYMLRHPAVLLKLWKVLLVPFAALYQLGTLIFTRLPPLVGSELSEAKHPALFAKIRALESRFQTPRIARVLLTPELNAGVSFETKYPFFSPRKPVLVLGLTLLEILDEAQLEAVLAHEFAHIAGGDVGRSQSLYRTRMWWSEVEAALQRRPGGRVPVLSFALDKYLPRLFAYTFVVARENEYEADRRSAEQVGPSGTASALIATDTYAAVLDEHFWKPYFETARESPTPPRGAFHKLPTFLTGQTTDGHRALALRTALARMTDHFNTHPSLRDRLESLGVRAEAPGPIGTPCSVLYLGELLDSYREICSANFENSVAAQFAHFHAEHGRRVLRYEELEEKEATSVDERFERAMLARTVHGRAHGVLALQAFVENHPDHEAGRFVLAAEQVDADDDEGLPVLEQFADQNPRYRRDALSVLIGYAMRRGDRTRADELLGRLDTELARIAAVEAAYARFDADSPITEVTDAALLDRARARLAAAGVPATVYLVHRLITGGGTSTRPVFVIAIVEQTRDAVSVQAAANRTLANELLAMFPKEDASAVFVLPRAPYMKKKFAGFDGCRVHEG